MNFVNNVLTTVEKGFNVAGAIPAAAIPAGVLRSGLGAVQAVTGTGMAGIGAVTWGVSRSKWGARPVRLGGEHIKHGLLNILRGLGEALAGCTVVGSLGLLVAQFASENKFNPIYGYTQIESKPDRPCIPEMVQG